MQQLIQLLVPPQFTVVLHATTVSDFFVLAGRPPLAQSNASPRRLWQCTGTRQLLCRGARRSVVVSGCLFWMLRQTALHGRVELLVGENEARTSRVATVRSHIKRETKGDRSCCSLNTSNGCPIGLLHARQSRHVTGGAWEEEATELKRLMCAPEDALVGSVLPGTRSCLAAAPSSLPNSAPTFRFRKRS